MKPKCRNFRYHGEDRTHTLIRMDYFQDQQELINTCYLPGLLPNNHKMKEIREEIAELFHQLALPEQEAVVNARAKNNKKFAEWFWPHIDKNPSDFQSIANLMASISPWWHICVKGHRIEVDALMRMKYPEWQQASDRGDIQTLDRLLALDNPLWKPEIFRDWSRKTNAR